MSDITVLKITPPINESADNRNVGYKGNTAASNKGPGGLVNAYDWRVWSGSGFGKRLQSGLPAGRGFSFEVTDIGQYVSVRASYHNSSTGKSISKTFVIVFDNPKLGDGKIFATSTKWRTFSNVDQAATYINSAIRALMGPTETNN